MFKSNLTIFFYLFLIIQIFCLNLKTNQIFSNTQLNNKEHQIINNIISTTNQEANKLLYKIANKPKLIKQKQQQISMDNKNKISLKKTCHEHDSDVITYISNLQDNIYDFDNCKYIIPLISIS